MGASEHEAIEILHRRETAGGIAHAADGRGAERDLLVPESGCGCRLDDPRFGESLSGNGAEEYEQGGDKHCQANRHVSRLVAVLETCKVAQA